MANETELETKSHDNHNYAWRVRFMGKVLLCRVFEINASFTKQYTHYFREVKWFAKHLLFQKWIFSAPEIWGLVENLVFDTFTLNRIQK